MNSADADGSLKDRTVASVSNAERPLMLTSWRTIADRIRQRVEFGDLLLYLYVLTISRQCFWSFPLNRLAWLLSIFVAAFCSIAYVVTKHTEDTSHLLSMWIVMVLHF